MLSIADCKALFESCSDDLISYYLRSIHIYSTKTNKELYEVLDLLDNLIAGLDKAHIDIIKNYKYRGIINGKIDYVMDILNDISILNSLC